MNAAGIANTFRRIARHNSLSSVFSDFCEVAAISLSNSVDKLSADAREARYLEIVKSYEKHADTFGTFPKILGDLVLALESGRKDVLGTVFHELGLHDSHKGQYFTPFEICQMSARILLATKEEPRKLIEKHGFIRACEPGCGSGSMVIALADILAENQINYQRHLHVTAIDVDRRAVHMAYVQLSLLHIPAIVIHGNSLSSEEYDRWYTPAHILEGWTRKLRSASSDVQPNTVVPHDGRASKEGSASASRHELSTSPQIIKPTQLTLF